MCRGCSVQLVQPRERSGEKPYDTVASQEGLTIDKVGEAGLVPDWDALAGENFDPSRTDPDVRKFYEKTSLYRLDVWSETRFPGRLFLWLIVYTVSRLHEPAELPGVRAGDESRHDERSVGPAQRPGVLQCTPAGFENSWAAAA